VGRIVRPPAAGPADRRGEALRAPPLADRADGRPAAGRAAAAGRAHAGRGRRTGEYLAVVPVAGQAGPPAAAVAGGARRGRLRRLGGRAPAGRGRRGGRGGPGGAGVLPAGGGERGTPPPAALPAARPDPDLRPGGAGERDPRRGPRRGPAPAASVLAVPRPRGAPARARGRLHGPELAGGAMDPAAGVGRRGDRGPDRVVPDRARQPGARGEPRRQARP